MLNIAKPIFRVQMEDKKLGWLELRMNFFDLQDAYAITIRERNEDVWCIRTNYTDT